MGTLERALDRARQGTAPSHEEALALVQCTDLPLLMDVAAELRDRAHGAVISYSRKVFIPLTKLCRDSCHYCTFAQRPRRGERCYLTRDEVLQIAAQGARAGCGEALFTLGDKPELRYRAAREELATLGHATTISYLAEVAQLVLEKTGLLPHANPGVLRADEIELLRACSVSQGIMLETAADRLSERGGPHFGSPDKRPALRLEVIRAAGAAAVPLTSGILLGIGETRTERLTALLALRALHERYGHLQEIIIQNFRAKAGTRMHASAEPDLDEHLWSIAAARIVFGGEMNIQAPPNLAAGALHGFVAAGINDWGGVSQVTPDHVNPERPWPALERLAHETAAAGKVLVERLAIYPTFVREADRWLDSRLRTAVLRASDAEGYARADSWVAGVSSAVPSDAAPSSGVTPQQGSGCKPDVLDCAMAGARLGEQEIVELFASRGGRYRAVCEAADALRAATCGNAVTYVVTRNINYTNVCYYGCKFCAFSKGRSSRNLRGRPYDLDLEEIQRRVREASDRGAVEVCLQGGIHPDYDGRTYLAICRAVKAACPDIHVHAFSPLEVSQGAATLGVPLGDFLLELKAAGLGSLPGTAAEILDDEVRAIICPDKISTAQWLHVAETAHRAGIRTTATIMFGHVDATRHWARHLLAIRDLQERTRGFTELVPLPFVPLEAPLHLRGQSRLGPTFREAVLMHAVARLVLQPVLTNIQTSWVKMGAAGAQACLRAGANDLGGTLMNESITRAAGAVYGQELSPEAMTATIAALGREPAQRTTLYGRPRADRTAASFGAPPLLPSHDTPARRRLRRAAEPSHHNKGVAEPWISP